MKWNLRQINPISCKKWGSCFAFYEFVAEQPKKSSFSEVWSVNFFVGLVVEDNESICLTIDTLPTMKSFQHFNANSQDLEKNM